MWYLQAGKLLYDFLTGREGVNERMESFAKRFFFFHTLVLTGVVVRVKIVHLTSIRQTQLR